MQDLAGKWAPLVARVLIAAIFVWSGVGKILNFEGTQGYMASKGMPLTALFAVGAIAVELGGGLALAAGFRARSAALALALFMVPTTLMFHGFWAYEGQDGSDADHSVHEEPRHHRRPADGSIDRCRRGSLDARRG